MRWTATCPTHATNELSDVWVNAADRQEVADASNEIDRGSRQDPLRRGVDEGDHRSWTVGPLTVGYAVSPDDRLVHIIHYNSPLC
jgi:hypothetical protein